MGARIRRWQLVGSALACVLVVGCAPQAGGGGLPGVSGGMGTQAGPPTADSPAPSGSASPTQSGGAAIHAATEPGNAQAPAADPPFTTAEVATFDEPWAAAFLGATGYLAVTERKGRLLLHSMSSGRNIEVAGTPQVAYAGQGGLGDIVIAPGYNGTTNRQIYLSWAEPGSGGTAGAVVGRADLIIAPDAASARLDGLQVIWRQTPKVTGSGHFSHRMVFSADGRFLYVSSGDRQKMTPAQDLGNTLGTIVRLTPDGQPAPGNPFADRGGASAQIWAYGHRNVLGLAFDASGRLWASEMGPQGGDELNLIQRGGNYGWPQASNGSHYGGGDIPDHRAGDGFVGPMAWWNPSISPGGLMIYPGERYGWKGNAFVPALSGEGLIRVEVAGPRVRVADYWKLGQRIREVEQGPDGFIYLLEDGSGGRLLRLMPG